MHLSLRRWFKIRLGSRASGNPNKIRMQLEGVENVRLEQGRLHIKTSVNEVIEERPYAYQIIDGIKKEIACFFVWKNATLSF